MIKGKFVIATDRSYSVHPLEGIMQIQQITNEPTVRTTTDATPDAEPAPAAPPPLIPDKDLAQQFAMKQAMKHIDWPLLKEGQYKQLNQYWNQGMFSHPMPLPRNCQRPSNAVAISHQSLWYPQKPYGM